MSELEMAVKALTRCVPPEAFSAAMAAVRSEEGTAGGDSVPHCDHTEAEIRQILKELGVPSHILGHGYLITAVKLLVKEPALRHEITNGLYPQIAELHGTTKSRAEKAIRHAIEVAWDRLDLEVHRQYFGNSVSAAKGKPTNSEFLCTVSDVVRLR